VRRRGEVGKVRLREANVLETSMLCLFYYLRGPVVLVFRIYKDRISIIKWKRWSRFAHPETTARSRDATLAVCISGGPAAGGYFDFPLLWAHELLGLRALQHCCSRTLHRYRRLKLPLAAARAAATPCSRAAARRATTCRARYCVSASSRAKGSLTKEQRKKEGKNTKRSETSIQKISLKTQWIETTSAIDSQLQGLIDSKINLRKDRV